jgi:hypothetical protein
MRLNDIADPIVNYLFGRLLRRAIGILLMAAFVLVALYYASGAAVLVLANQFGTLQAYLIMAAIYAGAALTVFVVLWATRGKPTASLTQSAASGAASGAAPDALGSPRNMQIAMLIEAVMLGYAMARKPGSRLP